MKNRETNRRPRNMQRLSHFFNVVKGFLKSPLEVPQSRTILVNVNGQTHILQVSL